MKLFTLKVDKCSGSYHSEGGLVVVAPSREDVRRICETYRDPWEQDFRIEITDEELTQAKEFELKGKYPESVETFPNAGCC